MPKSKHLKKPVSRNFADALNTQMRVHGDTILSLLKAVEPYAVMSRISAARAWAKGDNYPRFGRSLHLLHKIEDHYRLPQGYFEDLLVRPETPTQRVLKQVAPADLISLRQHLPRDFDVRSESEREEVIAWIRANVLSGATDYGKFQRRMLGGTYSVRFTHAAFPPVSGRRQRSNGNIVERSHVEGGTGSYGIVDAPARLTNELANLVQMKTAVLPPPDISRSSRWTEASARACVHRYSQMFGALASAPQSHAKGRGIPLKNLSFGMLIFPAVWDWYLRWREQRRGFFTLVERGTLYEIRSMSRDSSGWLRQHPELRKRLAPIKGLISKRDISVVQRDWEKANDRLFRYASDRSPDIIRASRAHRDAFLPILAVLHAENPLGEYKKIADEIVRQMPYEKKQGPISRAVAVRTLLMFRLTLHLGVRQKNLRQLLLCGPGQKPHTAHKLEELGRGELIWDAAHKQWDIFIPAVAFKNQRSSFFKGGPYQLSLPDLERLYFWVDEYLHTHRPVLLGGRADPGTFFIKAAGYSNGSAELDMWAFYEAWKHMIRKYGIYNPYTQRGAIKGLLPHGPHCVRDILATHILKQTGSLELASYAIQDSVDTVKHHYARFLPHEKVARAAEVLNEVWK